MELAEGGMNATLFNVEQKAKIFCYLANSEYKMRNKYEDFLQSGDCSRTFMTYVIMTNCEEIYRYAHIHVSSSVSAVQR
ncbi:hypothetical protein [Prevotella intermedia]|uniref:hypothetical protein n=1 Tax=Prevotella intermedia TaxID=28131 RepID=UPI0020A2FB97|nr:hypothetical protein [Prevotella intermedia]